MSIVADATAQKNAASMRRRRRVTVTWYSITASRCDDDRLDLGPPSTLADCLPAPAAFSELSASYRISTRPSTFVAIFLLPASTSAVEISTRARWRCDLGSKYFDYMFEDNYGVSSGEVSIPTTTTGWIPESADERL